MKATLGKLLHRENKVDNGLWFKKDTLDFF